MRIIISPAKKMKVDIETLPHEEIPRFVKCTEELLQYLKTLDYSQLKAIWKCNDAIATLNYNRIKEMDLYRNLTPAIVSYEGIQYQYMAPNVFSGEELDYVQNHLRILSGFYGMLKPFDGVVPYRLEMQAKLGGDIKNLYQYWNCQLAQQLFQESKVIINLASKEYSKCISDYLKEDVTFITCVFGEIIEGKVVEKGTKVKMARGEMVRFMAENQIKDVEGIKDFHRLNYSYSPDLSNKNTYVFIAN